MTILTNADIEEIIRLLDGSPYDNLRVTTPAFDLTVRRQGKGWVQERQTLAESKVIGAAQVASAPTVSVIVADDHVEGLIAIRSPMVGTFYRAPKPGAAPFVETGARVETQTAIGIIETMKLMNSIPAGATGTVTEILAENGALVQAGQILMRLTP